MPDKQQSHTLINSDGGSVIDGDVRIDRGDFIGRDKIVHGDEIHIHTGQTSQTLEVPPPPDPTGPPEILGFVGRNTELEHHAEQLAQSNITVITGMAGVGKTALATQLVEWVTRDRDRVFWHSFREGEGIDAIMWRLAAFLAWHNRSALWQSLQIARLTGSKPPPSEALFDYLLQLVREGNFLLCFDDFHHVDEDPVLNQLVERLRQALLAGNLKIVLTSRRVPSFLTVTEIEPLTGLSLEDLRRLLRQRDLDLDADQIDELHSYTAGNAEFLTLAIATLQQSGNLSLLLSQLAESEDVERYLLEEVDETLSGQERSVMKAVSILLGYPGTRDVIEEILGGRNTFRILRNLTERHLLIAQDGEAGREYVQHALVRNFYYEQMRARERRSLHRNAGEYYEEEESLLDAGIHFERAREYEQAAQLATQDIWQIINRGQLRRLNSLLVRFRAKHLEPVHWIEVNLARGQLETLLAENAAAQTCYQEALFQLEMLAEGEERHRLHARICHGMGELLQHESPQEALEWLSRGLQSPPADSPADVAALSIRAGYLQMQLGRYAAAKASVESGMNLIPSQPSQLRVFGLTQLGSIASEQGDVQLGITYTTQALAMSRRLHDDFWTAGLLINLGIDRDMAGEWNAAVDAFQEGMTLAEKLGTQKHQLFLALSLGRLNLNQGNFQEATIHLQQVLSLAEQANDHMAELRARVCMADMYIRRKQWADAATELDAAESFAIQLEAQGDLAEIHALRVDLLLHENNLEVAQQLAEQTATLAHELEDELEIGRNLRALGKVLAAAGHIDRAVAVLKESLCNLVNVEPYEAARTKVTLGLLLHRRAESKQADGLLTEARDAFRQLDAKHDMQELNLLVC